MIMLMILLFQLIQIIMGVILEEGLIIVGITSYSLGMGQKLDHTKMELL